LSRRLVTGLRSGPRLTSALMAENYPLMALG
jgi:hypothetical protein